MPVVALAQNAEIAGVVRDASGAVLPGVTVEASSPALIEQSRVVFTDGQGQYRVIALVPGTYKVTYTLPGFNTVIREGIVLTAEFTAAVDINMTVGSVEESITVSGQTPLVDIQATTQRRALTAELLNDLPTGRSFQNLAILVPGVQMPLTYQDVGGADGNRWQTLKVHGSRDDQMPLLLNGMPFNNMNNTGGGYNHTLAINTGTVQEMTITTSGSTAEVRTSGVVSNTVAKEGGNQFNYYLYTDGTGSGLQSDNLSDDLIARGLTSVPHVKRVFEINPTMGGPIVRSKLWFYGGYRFITSQKYLANSFYTKDPTAPQYCARAAGCLYQGVLVPDSRDLSQQDFAGDSYHHSYTGNLTWQASQRNKFNVYYHKGVRHLDNDSFVTQTPEASSYLYSDPDDLFQVHWTNPVTSRLLLEGGFTNFQELWWWIPRERPVFPDTISKLEASTGTSYGSLLTRQRADSDQYNMRFAVNYVTGSHAFKVGMQNMWGTRNFTYTTYDSQRWIFFNGAPLQITQYARPLEDLQKLRYAMAFYAQDKWTLRNLTFNLGLRFDFHNAYVPAQTTPDIPFVAAQSYPEFSDTPNWKDIAPRLGAAWDVRSNGKTVVRFNYGRYVASESTATATANNPVNTRINSANRSWSDANGNFFPDCDLVSTVANGECGALSAPLGRPNIVTRWDPAVLDGWNVRPDDYEILVGVQQQLTDRINMDLQWTRHWFGNFFATQYLATPPSDYDSYCITAPSDSRLPGGGGNQLCGFTDIKPSAFGRTPDNVVTAAENFGNVENVWSGVDLSLTARLAGGGVASGGFSTGRERSDFCEVIDKAEFTSNTNSSAGRILGDNNISAYPSTNFCRVTPPFQPDWKALLTYPLPWGLNVSGTWQNRAGPQILAAYTIRNGTDGTTLGRNLTLGGATAHLIQPGTMYADRLNQVDVRVAKSIRFRDRGRLQATVSVFNLLNANTVLVQNNTYGPSWQTPLQILQGRLLKFGAQLEF